QTDRLRDLRNPVASALLASGDCDRTPVLDLPGSLPVIQVDHAALREQGRYSPHAQLGCLLNHPVHSLAARDALCECEPEGRFTLPLAPFRHTHEHAVTAYLLDRSCILTALAVEQRQHISCPQPQYARNVVRRVAVDRQRVTCP